MGEGGCGRGRGEWIGGIGRGGTGGNVIGQLKFGISLESRIKTGKSGEEGRLTIISPVGDIS